jgi:hypothetical protein
VEIRHCEVCTRFAADWRGLGDTDDPLVRVQRESTQALFGVHLASAHAEAESPAPAADCRGCQDLAEYVAAHGEDSVAPDGCSETAGQLLRQHLLGHLIPHVPLAS